MIQCGDKTSDIFLMISDDDPGVCEERFHFFMSELEIS